MGEIKISKLIRSRRRSIAIEINPEAELIVKAPLHAPMGFIERFIREKSDWINKHLEKQAFRRAKKKQYTEGEEFFYLGKSYSLQLGNFLEISVANNGRLHFPHGLSFRIQKELTSWYIKQAKTIISQRAAYHARQMSLQFGTIVFSDTKSKWGTCTHANNLQFNWRLVMAPLEVVDYVVIHELTHIKEKNHSHRFWNTVSVYTPAYRQHRKWLHDNSHRLTV